MTDEPCDHGDKQWRCPTCCLASLRRSLPRIRQAVATRDKTSGIGGGNGAFGSRTELNMSALALLQDINRAGGLNKVEHDLNTLRDPQPLNELRRNLRQWRSRADLILREAIAPFPLTWDVPDTDKNGEPTVVTRTIPCPVISQHGGCGGPLYVHRNNDDRSSNFSHPERITCKYDDTHTWTAKHGEWLRLGVLLGGTIGGAA